MSIQCQLTVEYFLAAMATELSLGMYTFHMQSQSCPGRECSVTGFTRECQGVKMCPRVDIQLIDRSEIAVTNLTGVRKWLSSYRI